MLRQHIHLRAGTDRREDTQAKLNSREPFFEACDDHLHFSHIQSPKSGRFIFVLGSVLMFGCPAFMIPASGQQPLQTLLVGVDRRAVTSLNGDWHYLVDQSPGRALYTGNGEINDKSYAMNTHPNIVGKHNEEYDFATAPT